MAPEPSELTVEMQLAAARERIAQLEREKAAAEDRVTALLIKIRRGGGFSPPKRNMDGGERVQLSLRVTPKLKADLDTKGAETGRALSSEAEFRLEQAAYQESQVFQSLALAMGSREMAGLLLIIGLVMRRARLDTIDALSQSGDHKVANRDSIDRMALAMAIDAAHVILEGARPNGGVGDDASLDSGVKAAKYMLGVLRVGRDPAQIKPSFDQILDQDLYQLPSWVTGETKDVLQVLAKSIAILDMERTGFRFGALALRNEMFRKHMAGDAMQAAMRGATTQPDTSSDTSSELKKQSRA